MSVTPEYIPIKSPFCWENYYPRIPYTHVNYAFDICCISCEETYKNPKSLFGDLALCLCPCAFLADILCCIPMIFGLYTLKSPV